MKQSIAIFFALFFIPGITGFAQGTNESIARMEKNIFSIDKDGVESKQQQTLESRMKELNISGVSIAVFDNGKILWTKTYGNREKRNSGRYEYTLSGSFNFETCYECRYLAIGGAKQISLDEDVNVKLRSWHVPENEFTKDKKVTIAGIISHTAGLTVHGFYGYNPSAKLPTVQEILDGAKPANSDPVRVFQEPGKSESYSGGGFTVLQLLLTESTGKKFSDLIDELVIKPAGMTHSTFQYPLPTAMKSHTAKGYHSNGEEVDGGYHLYPEQAAAGLWTTPSDLARFMMSIGRSYRNEPNGILQQASAKKMLTRIPGAGGLGIGIDGEGDAFRYRHSGGNEGFKCYAVAFANTGRGVVIMTNSDSGTLLIREMLRAISKEYHWSPMWPKE